MVIQIAVKIVPYLDAIPIVDQQLIYAPIGKIWIRPVSTISRNPTLSITKIEGIAYMLFVLLNVPQTVLTTTFKCAKW